MIVNCNFCGGQHTRGKCPAYNKRCNNYLKLNHFAKCFNMKKTRKVREINAETSDEDEFFVGSVEAESDDLIEADKFEEKRQENSREYAIGEISTISDWSISLSVNGNDVIFKLDTGAQVNILPKSKFVKLVKNQR